MNNHVLPVTCPIVPIVSHSTSRFISAHRNLTRVAIVFQAVNSAEQKSTFLDVVCCKCAKVNVNSWR